MKILAIYAINQHLADLYLEAEHERLLRQLPRKPSALRRAVASIRSAMTMPAFRSSPRSSMASTADSRRFRTRMLATSIQNTGGAIR